MLLHRYFCRAVGGFVPVVDLDTYALLNLAEMLIKVRGYVGKPSITIIMRSVVVVAEAQSLVKPVM